MTDQRSIVENGLRAGAVIRDNDPRMEGRLLLVKAMGRHHGGKIKAHCVDISGRKFSISVDRIHLDVKPRRSGFSMWSRMP